VLDESPLTRADDDELRPPVPRGVEDRVGGLPCRLDHFGSDAVGLEASRRVLQQLAMPFCFDRVGVPCVGSCGVQRLRDAHDGHVAGNDRRDHHDSVERTRRFSRTVVVDEDPQFPIRF
jgi:hypothetical protein